MKFTRKMKFKRNILGIGVLLAISETAISSGEINAPRAYQDFSAKWGICVARDCEPKQNAKAKIEDLKAIKNKNDNLSTALTNAYEGGLVEIRKQKDTTDKMRSELLDLLTAGTRQGVDMAKDLEYVKKQDLLSLANAKESELFNLNITNYLYMQAAKVAANTSNLDLDKFKAGNINKLWDLASQDDYPQDLVEAAVAASKSRLNHAQQTGGDLEFNRSDAAQTLDILTEQLADLEENAEIKANAFKTVDAMRSEAEKNHVNAILAAKELLNDATVSSAERLAASLLIKTTGDEIHKLDREWQVSHDELFIASQDLDLAKTSISKSQKTLEDLAKRRPEADAVLNEIQEFEMSGSPSVDLLDSLIRQDDTGGAIFNAVEDTYQLTEENNVKIRDNGEAVATNIMAISTNTDAILANSNTSSTNAKDISTNVNTIATNAENISTNVSAIATNAENISTNVSAIATNTAAISSFSSEVTSNTGLINNNALDIQRVEIAMAENVETLKSGIASSLAIAGMPATPGEGLGLSIGAGYFAGESAVAMGLVFVDSKRTFKLSVGHAGGETSASAGTSFKF
jgi:methyl-accepting chemotaxis protein